MSDKSKPHLKLCVYCNRSKLDSEFSLEHIWPGALGGKLLPDLFKTQQVCAICNNLCGSFVDGAFIKSWFVQNDISQSAHSYLDPNKINIAPLNYMGTMDDFPTQEGEICERWTGLAGEHIYHIHPSSEERWDGYAGGDIIGRNKKHGRAYIALTSPSEYWNLTALTSFASYFKKSKRCVINGNVAKESHLADELTALFPQPDKTDEVQKNEISYIRDRGNNRFKTQIFVDTGFDSRFLCKIALGLGHKLFDHSFGKTSYADELRNGLWFNNSKDKQKPKILGTNFINNDLLDKDLLNNLGWKGTWTITIMNVSQKISAIIIAPSGNYRSIVISDDPTFWAEKKFEKYKEGESYVIVPQRSKIIGPISTPDLLAHNLKAILNPELTTLEKMKDEFHDLPPKQPH